MTSAAAGPAIGPDPAGRGSPAGGVVVLAFNPQGRVRVRRLLDSGAEAGVPVRLVVADGVAWPKGQRLRPDWRAVSLAASERRHPLVRAERVLVERIPRRLLRVLWPAREGRQPLPVRAQRRLRKIFHKRVFLPLYRPVRPYVLARQVMRDLDRLHLESASHVIAADNAALPLAWKLGRRFEHLQVTTSFDSRILAGHAAERDVAVVTPWYPQPKRPSRGASVREQVRAVAPVCRNLTVYHLDAGTLPASQEKVRRILSEREEFRIGEDSIRVTVGGAGLHRVRAWVPRSDQWAVHAWSHADWLGAALGGEPIDAPVVHAHAGILGGYAAVINARADAKVFVTEHASFLDEVLEQPEARRLYREVVNRADGFFVAGDSLLRKLRSAFPEHSGKFSPISDSITSDAEAAARHYRDIWFGDAVS